MTVSRWDAGSESCRAARRNLGVGSEGETARCHSQAGPEHAHAKDIFFERAQRVTTQPYNHHENEET